MALDLLVVLIYAAAMLVLGYYGMRKAKGKPASVLSTSTDEPDERGLHD